MKIVGVSLGTRNGNNDAICKEALVAAREEGAEVSFVHLMDWDIQDCSGCVACSIGLVTGKGNICTRKDEFDNFRSLLLDADGILFCDPIFVCGATGLFHTIMDRFGPRADKGMNTIAHMMAMENGTKDTDVRLLKDKVISFIAIGGSDWATAAQYDHSQFAMTPLWKIIDNETFSWSKNIIMEDDKVERARQIGRNLAHAAADIANAKYQGAEGVCPHCHSRNFFLTPGSTAAICMSCGIEGKLQLEGDALRFVFTPEAEAHAHDTMSGKFFHADDIKENEGKAMANRKSPKYREAQARIASYEIEEILPPSRMHGHKMV